MERRSDREESPASSKASNVMTTTMSVASRGGTRTYGRAILRIYILLLGRSMDACVGRADGGCDHMKARVARARIEQGY